MSWKQKSKIDQCMKKTIVLPVIFCRKIQLQVAKLQDVNVATRCKRSHLTTCECDMIKSPKTDVNDRFKLGIGYNKWSRFNYSTDMR